MAASFSVRKVPMYFLEFATVMRTCQFWLFFDTPMYFDLLPEEFLRFPLVFLCVGVITGKLPSIILARIRLSFLLAMGNGFFFSTRPSRIEFVVCVLTSSSLVDGEFNLLVTPCWRSGILTLNSHQQWFAKPGSEEKILLLNIDL